MVAQWSNKKSKRKRTVIAPAPNDGRGLFGAGQAGYIKAGSENELAFAFLLLSLSFYQRLIDLYAEVPAGFLNMAEHFISRL